LLGKLNDRVNLGNHGSTDGTFVEVRFEWKRSSRSRTKDKRDKNRESLGLPSNTPSTSSLAGDSRAPDTPTTLTATTLTAEPQRIKSKSKSRSRNRRSKSADRESKRSVSPNPPSSVATHTTTEEDGPSSSSRRRSRRSDDEEVDDGDESDPEDSETPWTCHLILRSVAQQPALSSRLSNLHQQPTRLSSLSTQEVRVKVGACVPTPHHPKVVSLLKIPFPLPDIEVEKALVRKRVVTPAGVARPLISPPLPNSPTPSSPPNTAQSSASFGSAFGFNKGNGQPGSANKGGALGLVLTAEEIKDIVACTSLWLVVREGFGGVGKERRKGDGWRIRG